MILSNNTVILKMVSNKIANVPTNCPKIKDMDTRCGRGCVQNYTRFNHKIPIYLFCKCNHPQFFKG